MRISWKVSKLLGFNYLKEQIKEIVALLKPFTKRAYLVGGSVRDIFLENQNFNSQIFNQQSLSINLKTLKFKSAIFNDIVDFDIEIYDISEQDFANLMQSIGANAVGKSFFVYKYKNFDLSLPRSENKIGLKHNDFEVKLINDECTACQRRDFTINSIMLNIFTFKVLDFYGGIKDIKSKTLRFVNEKTFCEDSLRSLRAVQFAARFGFKIQSKTLDLAKSMDIAHLSSSRISIELIKFFKASNLEIGFFYLYKLDFVRRIFKVKLEEDEFNLVYSFLKTHKIYLNHECSFLYIFVNLLNLNLNEILKSIDLASKYKSIKLHPFLNKIDEFEFCKIALKMPLSSWLGLYSYERIQLAKKLKIYDKKLNFKFDKSELKDKKGKEIGDFIESKQKKFIIDYLKCL